MKQIKFIFILFIFISNSSLYASTQANSILKKMSLDEKINQIFIFNVHKPVVDKFYRSALKKHHPGSYILFGKDILSAKSLYNLTHKIQKEYEKLNLLPALFMIDQEGGHVTRIHTRPNLPSALSVSTAGSPTLSYKVSSQTSNILKSLGINVNLAPVVDLSDPNKFNFIGNRSFGKDPDTVVKYASTQAFALEENSIIPTFKHFPGHGDTTTDSHKGLPQKLSTLSDLRSHDLLPFKKLIKLHPGAAVLVGHIAFPKIDSSGVPATFSNVLLTDILKNELGFKGLIITDDLQMHALKGFGSLKKRAALAFNAGADLLMITGSYKTQSRLIKNFKKLILANKISIERLNESVLKVIHAKLKVKNNILKSNLTYSQVAPSIKRSVLKLKKNSDLIIKNNLISSMEKIKPILNKEITGINKIKVYSAHSSFYKQVKNNFPNKNFKLHRLRKSQSRLSQHTLYRKKTDLNIFYVTGLGTLRMLSSLPSKTKKRTIVINSTHPGAIKNSHQYKNIININSPYIYSGKLFSKILKDKPQERGLSSK